VGGVDAEGDEPGREDVLEEVDGIDEVEECEGGVLGDECGVLEPGEEDCVYAWTESTGIRVCEAGEDGEMRTETR
jgi:hypothetical protein